MAFVSNVGLSSTSALLTYLQTFMVSQGWTIVASGVSGLAENFVARSSGVSGDRLILLKFGISAVSENSISVFACTAFNSATSVATNATTERNFSVTSNGGNTLWLGGDADYVFLGNTKVAANNIQNWLYAGLTNELLRTTSATPNYAIVVTAADLFAGAATARLVENGLGNTNQTLNVGSMEYNNVFLKGDPNLLDGRMYLFPLLVCVVATDRLLGQLKNTYAVGSALAGGTLLDVSGQGYTVFQTTRASAADIFGNITVKNS